MATKPSQELLFNLKRLQSKTSMYTDQLVHRQFCSNPAPASKSRTSSSVCVFMDSFGDCLDRNRIEQEEDVGFGVAEESLCWFLSSSPDNVIFSQKAH